MKKNILQTIYRALSMYCMLWLSVLCAAQSSVATEYSFENYAPNAYGKQVIVRNYHDTLAVMCYSGSSTLSPSFLLRKDTSQSTATHVNFFYNGFSIILQANVGYTVSDMCISGHYCYFCGTKTVESTDGYWTIDGQYVFTTQHYGYVGRFDVDDLYQGTASYEIMPIDKVESFSRLWVEDGRSIIGEYDMCHYHYSTIEEWFDPQWDDRIVLIGIPQNRVAASCIVDIRETSGVWDKKMYYPQNRSEVFVDVAKTNNYLLFASRFYADVDTLDHNYCIGLRQLPAAATNPNSLQTAYLFDTRSSETCNSHTHIGPIDDYSQLRICRMANDGFFMASNRLTNLEGRTSGLLLAEMDATTMDFQYQNHNFNSSTRNIWYSSNHSSQLSEAAYVWGLDRMALLFNGGALGSSVLLAECHATGSNPELDTYQRTPLSIDGRGENNLLLGGIYDAEFHLMLADQDVTQIEQESSLHCMSVCYLPQCFSNIRRVVLDDPLDMEPVDGNWEPYHPQMFTGRFLRDCRKFTK